MIWWVGERNVLCLQIQIRMNKNKSAPYITNIKKQKEYKVESQKTNWKKWF